MQNAHAKYSPSASSRWLNCTGSIHLTQNIQQETSPYAIQGQAAHWLAEKCLTDNLDPYTFEGFTVTNVGNYQLTLDDVNAVNNYVFFIREELKNAGENAQLTIEKKFDTSSISKYFFGTCDAILFSQNGDLKIYDYKHGAGVVVPVDNNSQMLCYALLAIEYAKSLGLKVNTIEIIIVQPRTSEDEYISRKFLTVLEFVAFKNTLIKKIKEIESTKNNPILTPGESQCRWCVAKPVCPEVRNKNLALAKAEFADNKFILPAPELLDENELVKILDHADFFRSWLTSIENFMEVQALNGKKIEGYKLVKKRAYRKWENPQAVIEHIKTNFSELESKIFTEAELRSPAQIESLLKKEDKKDIQKFISTPNTQPTLVKANDKRPEISICLTAQDEFN